PTDETPFKLCYGTEAVIPVEISSPSFRVVNFNETSNSDGMRTNLELLDEVRDQAVARMATYKQKTSAFFEKKVKPRQYSEGNLILRATEVSDHTNQGKLSANWEGPYKIVCVLRPGSYRLEHLD